MSSECCSKSGLCKWFCPSIVSVVAGLIMIAAGSAKLLAGKASLTYVGGMALSIFGITGHAQIALALGTVAALIEFFGGISFAVGCRKTSRWAAFFLSAVIGIALLYNLTHLDPLEGNLYNMAVGLLKQIRLDLLLFAVFFTKALKLIKDCCGMGSCSSPCATACSPDKSSK